MVDSFRSDILETLPKPKNKEKTRNIKKKKQCFSLAQIEYKIGINNA
jgi:hypothetical protein